MVAAVALHEHHNVALAKSRTLARPQCTNQPVHHAASRLLEDFHGACFVCLSTCMFACPRHEKMMVGQHSIVSSPKDFVRLPPGSFGNSKLGDVPSFAKLRFYSTSS